MKKRTLVLCSGGVDSLLALSMETPESADALFIDYGHPSAQFESNVVESFCRRFGFALHRSHVKLPRTGFMDNQSGSPVVSGRNAVLISIGASYAEALGFDSITIGANASDHDVFPDCRHSFFKSMRHVVAPIQIETPWIWTRKSSIIDIAAQSGLVDFWTCYNPTKNFENIESMREAECDVCLACVSKNSAMKR